MGKTGVIIGVVVGIVVAVAIVVPCVLLIPNSGSGSDSSSNDLPPFGFEDLYNGKYNYKSIYPNWDKSTPDDPTDFITMSDGAIVRRNIKKPYDNAKIIAPKSVTDNFKSDAGYVISADAKYIAYRRNRKNVWRHSYTSDYNIYDVDGGNEVMLNLPSPLQHLAWSPSGHKLAIVYNFTVHMYNDIAAANPTLIQVSDQGLENMDYYGIPDWMYEEEMISSNNVMYWSPESTRLAYLHTNEKDVHHIEYTWYGDGQYPKTIEIAYPKAGTTIGTATLHVYDIASGRKMDLPAPSDLVSEGDHYFSRFTWRNDTSCLATWTNRAQTKSIAQLCILNEEGTNFTCSNKQANKEDLEGQGWVGSFGPFYPVWRDDSDRHDYFTIYTRNNAAKTDGYWQLAYVTEDNDDFQWMTNTNYDIVEVVFYDTDSDYVYFTAAYDLPKRRHLMRVKWNAKDVEKPHCATCDLMDLYPERCGWINPVFADDGRSVVINCRGNMVPMTVYYQINTNGNWENLDVLEDNAELSQSIAQVKWPRREYRTYESSNYPEKNFNYEIWFPSDFDESKKYPLLIEVYAGIEFQKVQDTWRRGFAQTYMVSNRDIIVASVDGRGSAYEGYKFMRQNYKKLGRHEPEDQTDFAKYLRDNYNYIDGSKIAIWGWSYGGYTTSHTLGYDNGNTFKCGIAVAPLADWFWYDAMYAERYMGKPQDNEDAYVAASIITGRNLENFKKSEYTLIHGTADDNVHFQSAAEMEKALVEKDVDFDAFFYADEAHSINTGVNANQHIYHQIDIRLSHCFGLVDSPYGGPK